MAKPTKEEIAAEIAVLQALKPVGKFAEKTKETIATAIEALTDGIDTTAEEFGDLSDDAQLIAEETMMWKDGFASSRPSKGFGELVE